jgi:hypothetical protein
LSVAKKRLSIGDLPKRQRKNFVPGTSSQLTLTGSFQLGEDEDFQLFVCGDCFDRVVPVQ